MTKHCDTDEEYKDNKVTLRGKIVSEFAYSHTANGSDFYIAEIATERLSGKKDVIPIMVQADKTVDVRSEWTGRLVRASGYFRSHNWHEENGKSHLGLSVFVQKFEEERIESQNDENHIFLEGYICKPPVYRETPLGREITDILLAVNRSYQYSDYIPCICWNENARFSGGLKVGTKIRLYGRIQSREYEKKISDDKTEIKTAYEISANKLEQVKKSAG